MSSDSPASENVKTTQTDVPDEDTTPPPDQPAVGAHPSVDGPMESSNASATETDNAIEQAMPTTAETPSDAEESHSAPPAEPSLLQSATQPDVESESEAATRSPVESEPAAESPVETPPSKPAEPRVRLNPTVLPDTAKAVPSEPTSGQSTTAAETGAAAASGQTAETGAVVDVVDTASTDELPGDAEAAGPTSSAAPPVEIPPRDEELGADLEAEIEAAVSAEESATAAADAVQAQAAETAEAAQSGLGDDAPSPGTRLNGKVQSIHGDNVFVEFGGRSPGVVSRRQFVTGKAPAVGDELDLVVDRVDESEGLVVLNLPQGKRSVGGNWDAVAEGQVVDCMVNKTNKGGLEVTVGGLRGFMPASQVDVRYVADLETYVGQKLRAVITEANPKKRNLIISRRRFLDIQRKESARELWKTLEVGQTFDGTVRTIKDYGAFVDIGGVDGFLHVGEISWSRVNHPTDVLQEGQQVQVRVIKLDPDNNRISLGMKQLLTDPWTLAADNYPSGSIVTGRVTRTMDFGAFIELEPGVEGLVHISELDHQRVNKVTDVLNVNQEIELKVLDVDPNRRRIGLSLKQLQEKPPELDKPTAGETPEVDSAPGDDAPERKRKDSLKGGTGSETVEEGLFGDPKDFS